MKDLRDLRTLQIAVDEAERFYDVGKINEAFEGYKGIAEKRFFYKITDPNFKYVAADVIIQERLADLSILVGNILYARNTLTSVRTLYLQNTNLFGADFTTIRIIHLALEAYCISDAKEELKKFSNAKLSNAIDRSISNLESMNFSKQDLISLEKNVRWSGIDNESRSAFLVRLYLVMGEFRAARGQFNSAIHCFERGEFLASTNQLPSIAQVCAPLQISMAEANLALGNFAICENWLSKVQKSQISLNFASQVRLHELSGKLYLMKGQYGEAVKAYSDAYKQCKELKLARAIAIASLNNAHLLILLNQIVEALEYLTDISFDFIDDKSLQIQCNVLKSLAHLRRQSTAEEIAFAPSVFQMRSISNTNQQTLEKKINIEEITDPSDILNASSYLSLFENWALTLQWHLSEGLYRQAASCFEIISARFMPSDSPLIHARIYALQGLVNYYLGNFAEAETALKFAISQQQRLGLLPEEWQSKRILAWCLARQDKSPQETLSLNADIQAILDKLASSLNQTRRSAYLLNKWTVAEEYILSMVNELTTQEKLFKSCSWWRRPLIRFGIIKKINSLLFRIDRNKLDNNSYLLNLKDEQNLSLKMPPSLWQRLFTHSLHAATIHYFVLPDRVLLIQQRWLNLGFGISPITRIDLHNLISSWYQEAKKVGSDWDSGIKTNKTAEPSLEVREITLDRLGDALRLNPLLDNLPKRIKSLKISPDGGLFGFPFAALKYKGTALPEHFSISITLPIENEVNMSGNVGKKALLIGVSEDCGNGYVKLDNVESELDYVRSWMVDNHYEVESLVNREANESNILRGLEGANLLHIACHGEFQPDKPGESGFVLLPTDGNMQVLSLTKLSCLNLHHIEHATLSACWTADRFISPSRLTIGLPETMIFRGARSVLACLWEVDDDIAVHFMKRFYEYLEKYPRDQALQKTQLDCIYNRLIKIQNHIIDTSSPFIWAGFTLFGSNS